MALNVALVAVVAVWVCVLFFAGLLVYNNAQFKGLMCRITNNYSLEDISPEDIKFKLNFKEKQLVVKFRDTAFEESYYGTYTISEREYIDIINLMDELDLPGGFD